MLSGRFWAGICLGAASLGVVCWYVRKRHYRATQVTIHMPFGLGNITYEATDQDRILAWKMYVQLKTRKAALPFNDEHDLIANVCDSLHEIFPVTRDLLSEACPRGGVAQKSVTDFVLRVLNDGIRPHLTKWHPAFRTWWDKAVEAPDNNGKSPQEIQRQFPLYDDLVADLRRMNDELGKYAEELLAMVHATPKGLTLWSVRPKTQALRPDHIAVSVPIEGTKTPASPFEQTGIPQSREDD